MVKSFVINTGRRPFLYSQRNVKKIKCCNTYSQVSAVKDDGSRFTLHPGKIKFATSKLCDLCVWNKYIFWVENYYKLPLIFISYLTIKVPPLVLNVNSAAVGLGLRRPRLIPVPNTVRWIRTSALKSFFRVRFQNRFRQEFSQQKQRSVREVFPNTSAILTIERSKIWSAFKFRS